MRGPEHLPKFPSTRPEREWSARHGGCLVAGIDEAGRGPLAGPVVAAAVIWDFSRRRPPSLNDSKTLSEAARERLFPIIQRHAIAWGVGICDAQEIDHLNILEATRRAAVRALAALSVAPGALVTDALTLPECALPALPLIKGDRRSTSIAAASVLAKVTRDRIMTAYAREFPAYGWERNRGYPTVDHYAAIEQYGPTVLHRLTFSGVGFFCVDPLRSPTFLRLAARTEHCTAGGEEWAELEREVAAAAAALPPPDARELCELMARRRAAIPGAS